MEFVKHLLLAVALVGSSASALASPATDLFDQAVTFMVQNYHGYSTVKPAELGAGLRSQLEAACANNANCPFSVATPFVQRLASGMGDGHTYYMSPSSYERAIQEFSGSSANPMPVFGFQMGEATSRGEVLIEDVVADSPAFQAGLRPFDRVASVDGQPLGNNAVNTLRSRIQTGEPVRLEVLRGPVASQQRLTLTMQRRALVKTNLPFLYQPAGLPAGVWVMRFPTFVGTNDIAPRAHALVREAQAKGATTLLIDVRGNGGGEETECYGAASAFIGRAVNVNETTTQKVLVGFDGGRFIGNDPKDPNRYEITQPALWKGKVAVLTDNGTASCGELMAYMIQLAKRGPVVGEPTVGVLDTATEFWKLLDGSALAITYVRTINEDGTRVPERVTPNVNAAFDPRAIGETGVDPQITAALAVLERPTALHTRWARMFDLIGTGWRNR
jgi:carboxyl-terminal processing protease